MARGLSVRVPASVAPVFALVQHFAIGSLGFLGFYVLALGLSSAVDWLNAHTRHPAWVSAAGSWVEVLLFGADLLALALFVVSEVGKFARHLWRDWKEL